MMPPLDADDSFTLLPLITRHYGWRRRCHAVYAADAAD